MKIVKVIFIIVGFFFVIYLSSLTAQPTSPAPMEIHCKHFIYGYPLGTPTTNDLIIRDLYVLSSNDLTKYADWVCYRLTPHETMGTLDLYRKWRSDPWLNGSETLEASPSSQDDYRGVGSGDANDPNGSRYDRGHQAPLASFKGSRFASQVNFYSNITPQRPHLNQGPWKNLEDKVRELVMEYGQIWVMTGPLYERNMPPIPNCNEAHTVPSGYWKIIVAEENNSIQVAAFIMDQSAARNADYTNHVVSVADIQTRSGLNFFWEIDDTDENNLESNPNNTWVAGW